MGVEFGKCCSDAERALNGNFEKLLRKQENGFWYMTVGFAQIDKGTAWLDSAIFYCPSAGRKCKTGPNSPRILKVRAR